MIRMAGPSTIKSWGEYEILCRRPRYQVKKLIVNPGWIMSVQRHMHRSEHWIIVEGVGKAYTGNSNNLIEALLHEDDYIYIDKGGWHCIGNPGRIPLVFIEVQMGEYLEENDIERITKSRFVGIENV